MNIENLSFLTEITDEDASYVSGGGYYDYDPYTGEIVYIPTWGTLPNIIGALEVGANPVEIIPTNFGGGLGGF